MKIAIWWRRAGRPLMVGALLMMATVASAQERQVAGTVIDRDTREAAMQLTVQLLKTDSTFVKGTLTGEDGRFRLTVPEDGRYLVKLSGVGYKPMVKPVTMSKGQNVDLGELVMGADAIMLKGVTATAQAAKVTVVEDTFVYNAAAYRTPEGSVIEELVKKLPGAEVDDDGKITINGKEVKKIKVDGKEFMTGDTKTAMKNLPTSIVERVKAYDEKSDLARITGIDDGDETTVLDFGLKEGMHNGMFANVDLGIGTHSRYAVKAMGAFMSKNARLMAFAGANNVNDQGFPGGGGGGRFGRGMNGLNAAKMLGLNYNYELKDRLQLDASLLWNHTDGDRQTVTATENFVTAAGAFSNSRSSNFSRGNSLDFRARLEWKPDTMTNVMMRPSVKYSDSDGATAGLSRTFGSDPYDYTDDPLGNDATEAMAADSILVNQRLNQSASHSSSYTLGTSLQVNRKLNTRGRNVTLRGTVSGGNSESKSLSESNIIYYRLRNYLNTGDSTYVSSRYNNAPQRNWSYSLQATYSEPVFRNAFLQLSYKYTYKYNRTDRSTYDFSDQGTSLFDNYTARYGGWDAYFAPYGNNLDNYLDSDLSRFAEYKNYVHDINVMLRVIREKYRLNVGVMLQPQQTRFRQEYLGVSTDTTRNVFNFSPTLDFRYRFSKVKQLRINYRGTTSQPSMTDLLDITDDSDPLNISKGNPGLKPSFTHNFRLDYNNYIQDHQRFVMVYANYSNTRNSVASIVTYDATTGGRVTQPQNINGNWNGALGFIFNTAIDSAGVWNVNTSTHLNYTNSVGYLYSDSLQASQRSTTRNLSLTERLQGSWRKDWIEVALDGSFTYTHARNNLLESSNLDTWQFAYGGSINVYMPWGMSLSSDLHQQSRRGYSDASMNTNELIWNAQLSQSFLKGKALTVTLQLYDILHQQSTLTRTINSMMRSDTQYNSVNSYAMLHAIYRFNAFGGREGHRGMGPGGPDGDRRHHGGRDGGGFGGGRPRGGGGGFGGGRPGGGGFGGPR